MRFIDTGLDGADESLERWLLPLLPTAELFAAQSGFFSLAGWNLIAAEIEKLLERDGQVHLVVGGRPDQSDPQGLQAAHDLLAKYPDRASLVAVNDQLAMHTAKAYFVRAASGDEYGWVGSANLTGRGMKVNYQAGIQLGPDDDPAQLQRILDSVMAWQTTGPALRVDDRYIRELWPAARARVFASTPKPPRRIGDLIEGTLDVIEAIDAAPNRTPSANALGLPTGISDLDQILAGLQPGQLTIVGGIESGGKTALLLEFVRASCAIGSPAGYLTLQATVHEINSKLLAAAGRVPLNHLRGGYMTDNDWAATAKSLPDTAGWPLYLASHPTLTLDQLLVQIEDLAGHDVKLVAIDTPTHITVPGVENRERELAMISSALKAIALQLDIAVVGAWPLGRGPHQRTDKRPQLQDLRGSGQVEHDADVVILLHRSDMFYPGERPGEIDIDVAKHRNGPLAAIIAGFLPHYGKFVDIDSPR